MITIQPITNRTEWDELVERYSGHPLQLWGWGETKAHHGWKVDRVGFTQAGKIVGGAQLLIKQLPGPFRSLVYVPRGPFGSFSDNENVRSALEEYCKRTHRPLAITVEPDSTQLFTWKGWRKSSNRILLARTAVMDLTVSEDELQAVMSKKTRQYIRKAGNEGIVMRQAKGLEDVDACLAIYKQTATRAHFALHDDDYYHTIFTELGENSPVFMAEYKGQLVAFLWPIITNSVVFELYGGMNDEGQRLRANYYLKWEVIRMTKEWGSKHYDVNGLLNDGVTAFKKGFIPDETMMSGTYDKPLSPLYGLWSIGLPAIKKIIRFVKS